MTEKPTKFGHSCFTR